MRGAWPRRILEEQPPIASPFQRSVWRAIARRANRRSCSAGEPAMRAIRPTHRWAFALLLFAASCRSPAADAAIAEQLQQMSDALVAMRDQIALTSTTVDSLVGVVAKQDTLIKKLAAASSVPIP